MMEEKVLETVAKLLSSEADKELVKLGETILLSSNPTDDDIEQLNSIKGWPPMGNLHEKAKINQLIVDINKEMDIFK